MRAGNSAFGVWVIGKAPDTVGSDASTQENQTHKLKASKHIKQWDAIELQALGLHAVAQVPLVQEKWFSQGLR